VPHLFTRAVGVTGAPVEPAFRSNTDAVPTDWRAGANGGVLIHAASAKGDTNIEVLDTAAGATRPALASGFNESDGRWSPDGRSIAYVSDEFGQPDVFVQRWPTGTRVRVTSAGGTRPRWSGDGRALYVLRGDEIVRVDLHTTDPPSVSAPMTVTHVPGVRDYDVAHRGARLLAVLPVPDARPPEIRALVDWESAVR
jgi:dipeptidyl aminopeptidase/acylaminoacyl peptidase